MNVSDTVLVSLLLTLNRFTTSSSVFSTVNSEQLNACWDDNNEDNHGSRHYEDVDFTMNLILVFKLRAEGQGNPRLVFFDVF